MRSGRGEKSQPESPRRPSMRSVEAVQKFGKVGDLRFPGRAPQDGGASGADSSQQQGLRRSHAGEAEGDVGPVEAPRRGQHQLSRPGIQLLCPHPGQTFQMQVDGTGADIAPAGQRSLGPAQPRQQWCAEEDGGPHLCRSFSRKGAV